VKNTLHERSIFFILLYSQSIIMGKTQVNCPNCEKQFEEGFQFCPHCGQKAKDDLTLGVLFYNTISNYFSFDARFFKSFIPLMIQPGYLARRFVEGKRLLYLHPAQMYLFISVVFFFLFSFIARQTTQSVDEAMKRELERSKTVIDSLRNKPLDSAQIAQIMQPLEANKEKLGLKDKEFKELDSIIKQEATKESKMNTNFSFSRSEIDSLIEAGASEDEIYKAMGMDDDDGYFTRRLYAQALKFFKNRSGGSILQAFYDSIPIAMFILLPIFAFILKLLYYRKGRFAHHLVFSFYFFSFLFTVFSVLMLCNFIWDNFPGWIMTLVMLSTFFYLFIAVKRFYGQGWFLSFFKSSVTTFVFLMFVIPFATGIMALMALLTY